MKYISYLQFYFQSKTKYQVHSPFVFDFVEHILEDNRHYYFFDTIEKYRQKIYADNQTINTPNGITKVKNLAKATAVDRKTGQLLFKIFHHYKPKNAIQVGVFPGIAALYQCSTSLKLHLICIEKQPLVHPLRQYFEQLGVKNIQIDSGEMSQSLMNYAQKIPAIDSLFIKELPSKEATSLALECFRPESILLLYQPYQNHQRTEYWQWIKAQKKVTLTIDLYQLGVAFFREEQKETAHFKLIQSIKKPWAVF